MIISYAGPFIHIHYNANEVQEGHVHVQLADGYSYERLHINLAVNITELLSYQNVRNGEKLTFPPVNCKSPSILWLYIPDITKEADIRLTIEKFGQIPDPDYFNNTFNPILVTGNDGKKYKMIPSDQFK